MIDLVERFGEQKRELKKVKKLDKNIIFKIITKPS